MRESASVLVFSDRNWEIAVLPTGGIATRVPLIPICTNTSDPDNRIDRKWEIAVLPTGGIATRVPPIPIFTNTSDPDNRITDTDTDVTVW